MFLTRRFGGVFLYGLLLVVCSLADRKVIVPKSYAERDPGLVALAREIKSRGGRVSLRQVAAELASKGFTTPSGVAYSASAVASMLD